MMFFLHQIIRISALVRCQITNCSPINTDSNSSTTMSACMNNKRSVPSPNPLRLTQPSSSASWPLFSLVQFSETQGQDGGNLDLFVHIFDYDSTQFMTLFLTSRFILSNYIKYDSTYIVLNGSKNLFSTCAVVIQCFELKCFLKES